MNRYRVKINKDEEIHNYNTPSIKKMRKPMSKTTFRKFTTCNKGIGIYKRLPCHLRENQSSFKRKFKKVILANQKWKVRLSCFMLTNQAASLCLAFLPKCKYVILQLKSHENNILILVNVGLRLDFSSRSYDFC